MEACDTPPQAVAAGERMPRQGKRLYGGTLRPLVPPFPVGEEGARRREDGRTA